MADRGGSQYALSRLCAFLGLPLLTTRSSLPGPDAKSSVLRAPRSLTLGGPSIMRSDGWQALAVVGRLVGAVGLEPTISCSQSTCVSHYATPRALT
jgi:hypothetical protein